MGFKCALQIKGLTRGEPAPGKKHRMNLRKATMEAGYERASKSETLDKRRSHFNRYAGFVKGSECADTMENESEFTTVRKKDGTIVQRKARADLVPGFAVICNPPYEVCKLWDDATYEKYYSDSWECLCLFKPKIFRDENLVITAEHFDEGVPPEDITDIRQIDRHKHFIGYARDEKGGWCGNEIDAKFFVELNKVFPQMMRDRGWDMDELDTTDFERAKDDPEYRAERDYKRGQSGRSVNQYITNKAEKLLDEAEAIHNEAVIKDDVASKLLEEAEAIRFEIDRDADLSQMLWDETIQANMASQERELKSDEHIGKAKRYAEKLKKEAQQEHDTYLASAKKEIEAERQQMLREMELQRQEIRQVLQDAQSALHTIEQAAEKLNGRSRENADRFHSKASDRIADLDERFSGLIDDSEKEHEGME